MGYTSIFHSMARGATLLVDDQLDALREELVEARRLATDDSGEVLVWIGGREAPPTPMDAPSEPQTPLGYTPPRLAERIHLRTGRPLGSDAFIEDLEQVTGRPLKKQEPEPRPKLRNTTAATPN